MKTIIIFLLTFTIAVSQNIEPTQRSFNYTNINGNSINGYLNGDIDYFKLNNFMFGWHWGGERKISQVMKVNQNDMGTGWGPVSSSWYNDSTNLFVRSSYGTDGTKFLYTHCYWDSNIVFTKSLCYSAALEHDSLDDYTLIKLPNDPQNFVFGFRNKHPNCTATQFSDDDKWRLVVDYDSIQANTIILENPWPNNLLCYTSGEKDIINQDFAGRAFYLSINLRRLDNNDGYGSDTVLILEVPYLYNNKTTLLPGIATFSKLPKDSINAFLDKSVLNYKYGNIWATQDESSTKMAITKNMLPMITDSSKGDITISGYIDFNGILGPPILYGD